MNLIQLSAKYQRRWQKLFVKQTDKQGRTIPTETLKYYLDASNNVARLIQPEDFQSQEVDFEIEVKGVAKAFRPAEIK